VAVHFDSLEPRQFLSAPYQIRDLGTLGGETVVANDINNQGQIVGSAMTKDGSLHAVLWSPCNDMTDLNVPALNDASGVAINNRGQIIGTATYDAGLVGAQTFVISNGKLQFLPRPRDPDNNFAIDINDLGQILTFEIHIAGNELGSTMLYDPSLKTFAYVARDQSFAINNSGIIAGIQPPAQYSHVNPAFSARYVDGYALNDNGVRVSRNYISEGGNIITVGDGQTMSILQKQAGSPYIDISEINNSNVFIGSAWSADPVKPLFGWIRDGNLLRDLNALIPRNSGWQILHANAINDKGQIVGDGLHNGLKRAFVLTPTGVPFPKKASPTDIHLQELPQQQGASSTTATGKKPHHPRPAKHPKARTAPPSPETARSTRDFVRTLFSRVKP